MKPSIDDEYLTDLCHLYVYIKSLQLELLPQSVQKMLGEEAFSLNNKWFFLDIGTFLYFIFNVLKENGFHEVQLLSPQQMKIVCTLQFTQL